jgi:hypothetical protein
MRLRAGLRRLLHSGRRPLPVSSYPWAAVGEVLYGAGLAVLFGIRSGDTGGRPAPAGSTA